MKVSKSSSGFGTLGTGVVGVAGVIGVAGGVSNGGPGADTGSLSFLTFGWCRFQMTGAKK